MKAVILAGGRGTRLAPYTTILPKPLMPFGDYPILEIIICQLREHGFTDITLTLGYLAHLFKAYFGNGHRLGVNIGYSVEDTPLGTAGPLTLISDLDTPFLVMNADLLTDLDYSDLYRYHCHEKAAITVALHPKDVQVALGVLELNENAEVIKYIEKPTFSYLVSMGIYVVSPRIMQFLPPGQRFEFPDLVNMLMQRGEKVSGYVFRGEWLDVGRLEDYTRATESFKHLAAAAALPINQEPPVFTVSEPV